MTRPSCTVTTSPICMQLQVLGPPSEDCLSPWLVGRTVHILLRQGFNRHTSRLRKWRGRDCSNEPNLELQRRAPTLLDRGRPLRESASESLRHPSMKTRRLHAKFQTIDLCNRPGTRSSPITFNSATSIISGPISLACTTSNSVQNTLSSYSCGALLNSGQAR
jgi:hypothetical protein